MSPGSEEAHRGVRALAAEELKSRLTLVRLQFCVLGPLSGD